MAAVALSALGAVVCCAIIGGMTAKPVSLDSLDEAEEKVRDSNRTREH